MEDGESVRFEGLEATESTTPVSTAPNAASEASPTPASSPTPAPPLAPTAPQTPPAPAAKPHFRAENRERVRLESLEATASAALVPTATPPQTPSSSPAQAQHSSTAARPTPAPPPASTAPPTPPVPAAKPGFRAGPAPSCPSTAARPIPSAPPAPTSPPIPPAPATKSTSAAPPSKKTPIAAATTLRPRSQKEYQLQMKIAMERSLQDKDKSAELSTEMVSAAIAHLASPEIGINVSMPPRFARRSGNCLFESVALIRNSNLSAEDRIALTRELRGAAVGEAIRQVDSLSEERWERLLSVITTDHATPRTREEMKQLLTKYLRDGMYEDEGGDILPYMLSAHLNHPLIIVDVLRNQTTTTTIFPDQIFRSSGGQMGEPLLLVRRGEHYDPLIVVNGGEARVLAFFNQEWQRQVPSRDAVAATTTPSDPPYTTEAATTTTTTPASTSAGLSTPNAASSQTTTTTTTTTTSATEQHGQDFEALSALLEDCVLQEDSEDEDIDTPILSKITSNQQSRVDVPATPPIEDLPVLSSAPPPKSPLTPVDPPPAPNDVHPTASHDEPSPAPGGLLSAAPPVGGASPFEDPHLQPCYDLKCKMEAADRCLICNRSGCWYHLWKAKVDEEKVTLCFSCYGRHRHNYSPKDALKGMDVSSPWMGYAKGHDLR